MPGLYSFFNFNFILVVKQQILIYIGDVEFSDFLCRRTRSRFDFLGESTEPFYTSRCSVEAIVWYFLGSNRRMGPVRLFSNGSFILSAQPNTHQFILAALELLGCQLSP
jgi:hypothetical protein